MKTFTTTIATTPATITGTIVKREGGYIEVQAYKMDGNQVNETVILKESNTTELIEVGDQCTFFGTWNPAKGTATITTYNDFEEKSPRTLKVYRSGFGSYVKADGIRLYIHIEDMDAYNEYWDSRH